MKKIIKRCIVCDKKAKGQGPFCGAHYQAKSRHGHPLIFFCQRDNAYKYEEVTNELTRQHRKIIAKHSEEKVRDYIVRDLGPELVKFLMGKEVISRN